MTGTNWIELPPFSYNIKKNSTNAQLEVDVPYDRIISHAPDGEWSKIAPLRILSFDIECAGRKGIFPDPKIDQVIQIATMVTIQGTNQSAQSITWCIEKLIRRIQTFHSICLYIEHMCSHCWVAGHELHGRGGNVKKMARILPSGIQSRPCLYKADLTFSVSGRL